MSEVVIEIDGILKNIITHPKFKYIQNYADVLAETGEFSEILINLEKEIMVSVEDGKITKNEIRKIGVKMFYVLKILHDKNFKFKSLDDKSNVKLKNLLRTHFTELLTYLIVEAVNIIKKREPTLNIIDLTGEDIELIVGTIVDTAEWSINITKKSCSCFG